MSSKTPAAITAVKKITVAEIMGEKLKAPTVTTDLFLVYGVATQAVNKPTQYSAEQMVIYGRFEALRVSDRAKFSSMTLYLPEPVQSQIAAMLMPNTETGELPQVEIAFKVSYSPSKKAATGYTFTVEPVLDTKTQDALAAQRNAVDKMLDKLLPAPSK